MFSSFRVLFKAAAKYPKILSSEKNIFNLISRQYNYSRSPISDIKIMHVNIEKLKSPENDTLANYPVPEIIINLDVEGVINNELMNESESNMELEKKIKENIIELNDFKLSGVMKEIFKTNSEISMEIKKMVEDTIMVLKAIKSEDLNNKDFKKAVQIKMEVQKNINEEAMDLKAIKTDGTINKGLQKNADIEIQEIVKHIIMSLKALKS